MQDVVTTTFMDIDSSYPLAGTYEEQEITGIKDLVINGSLINVLHHDAFIVVLKM